METAGWTGRGFGSKLPDCDRSNTAASTKFIKPEHNKSTNFSSESTHTSQNQYNCISRQTHLWARKSVSGESVPESGPLGKGSAVMCSAAAFQNSGMSLDLWRSTDFDKAHWNLLKIMIIKNPKIKIQLFPLKVFHWKFSHFSRHPMNRWNRSVHQSAPHPPSNHVFSQDARCSIILKLAVVINNLSNFVVR